MFLWLNVSILVYPNFMQTFGWLCCSGILSFPLPRHHHPLALLRVLSYLCCVIIPIPPPSPFFEPIIEDSPVQALFLIML